MRQTDSPSVLQDRRKAVVVASLFPSERTPNSRMVQQTALQGRDRPGSPTLPQALSRNRTLMIYWERPSNSTATC